MPVSTEEAAFRPGAVARLKHLAVSDALRCLGACISSQAAAQGAFEAAMRMVAHKQELATCSSSDDDVEAFAAWLPEGRETVRRAGTRLEQAARSAANARAALRLARAALIAHDRVIGWRRLPISPQSSGSTTNASDC